MKPALTLALAPLLLSTNVQAAEKPNVLFIAVDDLNDWVGCMKGHPQSLTPSIDRLAQRGMLFTNAHCQAPISGPSRASVFTGLYPFNSGNYFQLTDSLIKKSNSLTQSSVFLPDYFEAHGYKTMGVGKLYHQGDRARTFDEFGGVFDLYGPRPKQRFKYDPAWFAEKTGRTVTDWGAFPEADSLMTDYKSAQWAIEKLSDEHHEPFFLAVGFVRPHVPWYVPQHWFDLFPIDSIQTPPYDPADMNDVPIRGQEVADVPMMPTTEWAIQTNQWKDIVQAYLACIAFVDAQIGKVLQALESSKYNDNTIIVLWSDHGYHLGEKNRFAKQAIWERDTRTPLIIYTPQMQKPIVTNAPVELIDIYPTLLDLCGLPAYPLADGKSLVPLFANPNDRVKPVALSTYGIGNIAIRDERYRLIRYDDGSLELYDMEKDPNEWQNLASNPEYTQLISKLLEHVPQEWAPNSKHSFGGINNYFNTRY